MEQGLDKFPIQWQAELRRMVCAKKDLQFLLKIVFEVSVTFKACQEDKNMFLGFFKNASRWVIQRTPVNTGLSYRI